MVLINQHAKKSTKKKSDSYIPVNYQASDDTVEDTTMYIVSCISDAHTVDCDLNNKNICFCCAGS